MNLGAFIKNTKIYITPNIANKNDNYICPDCDNDLIICKGNIKKHYFRHKVNLNNPCNYYTSPNESQIHKDAKLFFKNILEFNKIFLTRFCNNCKNNIIFDISRLNDTSYIQLEYKFDFNSSTKYADIAFIDNNTIKYIFEICYKNKTNNDNRPEPWFELNAENISNITPNENNEFYFKCIRDIKCEHCKELDYFKINDLNKYVRIKLGQDFYNKIDMTTFYEHINKTNNVIKLFENKLEYIKDIHIVNEYIMKINKLFKLYETKYEYKYIDIINENIKDFYYSELLNESKLDNSLYRELKKSHIDGIFTPNHERFDFDAQDNDKYTQNNKNICDIFKNDFNSYKMVTYFWKGDANIYLISNDNYNKYNYWDLKCLNSSDNLHLPYEYYEDMRCQGTVDIIINLINISKNLNIKNNCKYSNLSYNNNDNIDKQNNNIDKNIDINFNDTNIDNKHMDIREFFGGNVCSYEKDKFKNIEPDYICHNNTK